MTTTLREGEYLLDGSVYVTAVRAAEILSLTLSRIHTLSVKYNWRARKRPDNGRFLVFLHSDVDATPTQQRRVEAFNKARDAGHT